MQAETFLTVFSYPTADSQLISSYTLQLLKNSRTTHVNFFVPPNYSNCHHMGRSPISRHPFGSSCI